MPVDPIINRCFEPIFGLPCWQVKRGYGSFLTLEFGEPHLKIREPMNSESGSSKVVELLSHRKVTVCGQWHLWIQGCDWSVYEGEQKMGSSDDDDSMDAAARYLDGQKMTSMTITLAANSRFQFDLGGTFPPSLTMTQANNGHFINPMETCSHFSPTVPIPVRLVP